jgi:hypothetical protein
MDELFEILEIETSDKAIPISPPVLVPGAEIFVSHDTHKAIRKESIFVNGKRLDIRRIYLQLPQTFEYRNVGWVVYCDVSACMICSKFFWPVVGKR